MVLMVRVTVTSSDCLSNTTFHKRCSGRQKFWWLRNKKTNSFVPVPEVRGDSNFRVELDLEPGVYVLGTGPKSSHGIREEFEVRGSGVESSKIRELGVESTRLALGEMLCPFCGEGFTPKHKTKAEAFSTEDMESREQWISGCCSTGCWRKIFAET